MFVAAFCWLMCCRVMLSPVILCQRTSTPCSQRNAAIIWHLALLHCIVFCPSRCLAVAAQSSNRQYYPNNVVDMGPSESCELMSCTSFSLFWKITFHGAAFPRRRTLTAVHVTVGLLKESTCMFTLWLCRYHVLHAAGLPLKGSTRLETQDRQCSASLSGKEKAGARWSATWPRLAYRIYIRG